MDKQDYTLNNCLTECSDLIVSLRQNSLMSESSFIAFARERGLRVSGSQSGDPGVFNSRGWLASDGIDYDGSPTYHPFRLYPLHEILRRCEVRIADSITLQRYSAPELAKWVLELSPSADQITEKAKYSNEVADLAILLEPLYWPRITGQESCGMSEEQHDAQLNEYRPKALRLVEALDPNYWREAHKWLRVGAAGMDDNPSLYLLLRLANWSRREKLKGRIAGALWIRHIAEVIRRAFEDVHGERWPEEDQSFGHWPSGARTRIFGSDRPLDDVLLSKPYLAQHFELFTGSATRWYVEGQTEYGAVLQILHEPSRIGVEIVNLNGNIAKDRDNAALKLGDWLQKDQAQRRFSIISFDRDEPANVKTIRRQVEQNHSCPRQVLAV